VYNFIELTVKLS